MSKHAIADLVAGLRKGDRRAVARLISLVEDGAPEASEAIREVYPLTGHASTIGLTGAPGSGKSSLIDGLVVRARAEDSSVGVIACDPTSPFSGGALLGDRVRMQQHALDDKVFIRSMATRGHLGGLSLAAPEAMRVLEAAGSDIVIVETVGVGQSEVEVAKQADTTIVVLAPGMGDAIQAAKAGVLEIADIFCVNKSDKDGANETARDVRGMLELGHGRDPSWEVPIVMTSAATEDGIDELWAAIRSHEEHLRTGDRLAQRRRERFGAEIREIVGERLKAALEEAAGADVLSALTDEVLDRKIDPYTAAGRLLEKFGLPSADH
jgi:LAO/AO transport system kinase